MFMTSSQDNNQVLEMILPEQKKKPSKLESGTIPFFLFLPTSQC